MTEFLTQAAGAIEKAAAELRAGNIVALPTETVYGLAADACNFDAVAKVFKAKGRPSFNPLIIHVDGIDMASRYGVFNETAHLLAQTFWPGPLTIVLPLSQHSSIAENVTAGLKTVGIRHPAHDMTVEIIKKLGKPVAAPSANASGMLSPTKPEHVAHSLINKIPYIVTGGKAVVGLESTIVDLSGKKPRLLRAGFITREDIENLIGPLEDLSENVAENNPSSPGQLLKHYAPKTPLRLNAIDVEDGEALLAFGSVKFMGLKSGGHVRDLPLSHYMNLSEPADLYEAAANLFSMLHMLDQVGAEKIAVMNIPDQGIGRAINDRLKRAAAATHAEKA